MIPIQVALTVAVPVKIPGVSVTIAMPELSVVAALFDSVPRLVDSAIGASASGIPLFFTEIVIDEVMVELAGTIVGFAVTTTSPLTMLTVVCPVMPCHVTLTAALDGTCPGLSIESATPARSVVEAGGVSVPLIVVKVTCSFVTGLPSKTTVAVIVDCMVEAATISVGSALMLIEAAANLTCTVWLSPCQVAVTVAVSGAALGWRNTLAYPPPSVLTVACGLMLPEVVLNVTGELA